MIQDIEPYRYNNAYDPKPPKKDDFVIYCEGLDILVKWKEKEISFPTFEELQKQNPELYESSIYLFSIDEMRFYLARDLAYDKAACYQMMYKEQFRTLQPKHMAFAGITGFQLHNWYEAHRYCGRCKSLLKLDTKERMLYCEECKRREYPTISPAVIVGVKDGNRLLMSKYADRDYKKYALIAGFTEIGETVEETVSREVFEEVGLKVKNIRFYKSQPWSFTGTILLGFFADLDGSEEITLDREELAMAEWFEREEIPVEPSGVTLTNEMIIAFKESKI